MSRIFLDIGAYDGYLLQRVLAYGYAFDQIHAFEPQRERIAALETAAAGDPRVRVHAFGLWDRTGEYPFYRATGRKQDGASVYADKIQPGPTETIAGMFVRATEWFQAHLTDEDTVIVKLNIEGAECDLLEDLWQSGELRKVTSLAVAFDVRKVPSQAHRAEEVATRILPTMPHVLVMTERECYRQIRRGGRDGYLHFWLDPLVPRREGL